jgi:hypothetical protein
MPDTERGAAAPPAPAEPGRPGAVAAPARDRAAARRAPILDLGVSVDREETQPGGPTLGEVLVGGAVLLVGLVAWAGLGLASAGRWSLPAALGLALAGAALITVVVLRVRPRPRLVVDRTELIGLALLTILASIVLFPGAPYGIGDKDPGTYISHGISIARTGSEAIADPVLDRSKVPGFQPASPGARLPGLWYKAGGTEVTVQFYHLWPAALAAAWKLGGRALLVNLNPLLTLLAVLAFALAVRRAFGRLTGAVAGVLLTLNMLQVWQGRYQSAEMLTQALVMTALLGIMVALRTGWRPAAGVAGLLLGLAWLARGDSLLLVLIAVGVGAVLIVLGRFDQRAGWFGIGLAVVTPHALLQAYGTARQYTLANHVPGLPVVLGLIAGTLVTAVVLRATGRPLWNRLNGLIEARRTQVVIGALVVLAAGAALTIGFLRPVLFGPAYFNYHGNLIRSYDEQTMRRLSWFLTLPGFGLAGLGLALVALRRWGAAAWAAVLPVLLVFPVYATAAENSSRLMWWNRRFVPVVLPGIVTLIAVALVAGLLWKGLQRAAWLTWPVRAASGLLALALVVVFAAQSLPLRGHREFAGSFEVGDRIVATSGGRPGVYLFGRTTTGRSLDPIDFAVPVWLQHGATAVLLRPKPSPAYVQAYVKAFAGRPVFLVTDGPARPAGYESVRMTLADHITAALPMWDESDERRPAGSHREPVDLSVWRVEGS